MFNSKRTKEDEKVLDKIGQIKYENKVKFAEYLKIFKGIEVNPNHRFDVHVKRIREKISDHSQWRLSTVWGIGYKVE